MKKISVIIPCYNSSKYFDRITKSLSCYLDDPGIEIIFVDDRYSDEESALLKEYVDSYQSYALDAFYLKNEDNYGASISRKRGVEIAQGKYIAFLDSDDAWVKNKLYIQLALMERKGFDISGGASKYIEESEYKDYFERDENMESFTSVTVYDFLKRNYFSTSSIIVRRRCILDNNFSENLRYSEDYECWRRILLHGSGIYIHSVGTYSFKHSYLSDSGSLSSNLIKMSISEMKGFLMLYQQEALPVKVKLLIPFAILYSIVKSTRRILISLLLKGKKSIC